MLSNLFLKKSRKKDFLFLIIQVHLLILILVGVLWSMSRLNQASPSFLNLIFSSKNPQQIRIRDQNLPATTVPAKKPRPSSLEK